MLFWFAAALGAAMASVVMWLCLLTRRPEALNDRELSARYALREMNARYFRGMDRRYYRNLVVLALPRMAQDPVRLRPSSAQRAVFWLLYGPIWLKSQIWAGRHDLRPLIGLQIKMAGSAEEGGQG